MLEFMLRYPNTLGTLTYAMTKQSAGSSMMLKRIVTAPIFLLLLGFASPLWAQSNVQYVYDALGRLTQVIDPSGNVVTYNHDVSAARKSVVGITSKC